MTLPEQIDAWKVKLSVFEGPMELLLHLVRDNKMDIYDIPIAEITRQYMEYLNFMKEMNLQIAGDFLVTAADLLIIKSKSLLPRHEIEEDDEGEDPRHELAERLLEYERYRSAAEKLKSYKDMADKLWGRGKLYDEEPDEEYVFDVGLYDLIQAFQSLLKEKSTEEFHEVEVNQFSIKEKISEIMNYLAEKRRVKFSSLFEDISGKQEMIALFLALLELVRLRMVKVSQKRHDGDIWVRAAVKEVQEYDY